MLQIGDRRLLIADVRKVPCIWTAHQLKIDKTAVSKWTIRLSKVVNSSSRISSTSAISNRQSPICNILLQSALAIAFVARTIAKDSAKGCCKLAIGDC